MAASTRDRSLLIRRPDQISGEWLGEVRSTLHCTEPLAPFHVTLDATAHAHTDYSAPLGDEAGQPVPVSPELTWDTDGIPCAWRTRSRYEIPCRVTGVIRIGDQKFPFAGPGQRDHSWGLRDWWANDWMWSAFHLNDGTHTHAVTVPSIPGVLVVGYLQRGDTLSADRRGHTDRGLQRPHPRRPTGHRP